jgi:hypothetical protein
MPTLSTNELLLGIGLVTLVARRLDVPGAKGTLVLIVGGHELARAIAAARAAGLDADSGRMLIDLTLARVARPRAGRTGLRHRDRVGGMSA